MFTFDFVHVLGITMAVSVAWLVFRALHETVIVQPHEAVLVTRDGRDLGRLAAGKHRFFRGKLVERRFDLRELAVRIGGQEVLSRDRVPVRFALLVRYRVVDPVRARDAVADLEGHVHCEAQLALRDAVALFELAELLDGRTALSQRVAHDLGTRLERAGLALVDAVVQDILLGGDLKRAFGAAASARAAALADLERARGQAAALRKLANAARLFREHEGLAELKKLALAERAAEGGNSTLVLGLEGLGALGRRP